MSEAIAMDTASDAGYVVNRGNEPNVVPGRRAFFDYIELGVTDATDGKLRVQITKAKQGLTRPTGWHTHICEGQFVYMLDGWLDLAFADGTVHLEPGDSIYIGGGVPHNETGTSDTFELIEISIPAELGTEPCAPPPGCEA
jgi:mannose-6-phosphate isomerase-like protein (cupin superfamily)